MAQQVGNIIDTTDAAIDEFMEEGNEISDWHELSQQEQDEYITAAVQNRIDHGFWFRWSDGTIRDWTE